VRPFWCRVHSVVWPGRSTSVGDMSEPRGAGMGGGLLFLAVVLFLGYLVITTIVGILKWIVGAVLVLAVVGMALKIADRK